MKHLSYSLLLLVVLLSTSVVQAQETYHNYKFELGVNLLLAESDPSFVLGEFSGQRVYGPQYFNGGHFKIHKDRNAFRIGVHTYWRERSSEAAIAFLGFARFMKVHAIMVGYQRNFMDQAKKNAHFYFFADGRYTSVDNAHVSFLSLDLRPGISFFHNKRLGVSVEMGGSVLLRENNQSRADRNLDFDGPWLNLFGKVTGNFRF